LALLLRLPPSQWFIDVATAHSVRNLLDLERRMKFNKFSLVLTMVALSHIGAVEAQDPPRRLVKSGIGEQTIILTNQEKSSGTAPKQDCSQTLDKVIAVIGSPNKLASIHSVSFVGTTTVKRASAISTFRFERVALLDGSTRISLTPTSGVSATAVITPEFNYLISGKVITAVPASNLQEIVTSLKLDPIYLSQHRNAYGCQLEGTEKLGNVDTVKLNIKSSDVEGHFNIDPSSNRLIRTSFQYGDSTQSTDFSEWREIDGIYIAIKRHVSTNSASTDLTVTEVHVNPVIDPSLFQRPANRLGLPTPL